MSLRSVQFVRSVKFLTVRKLHVISDTYNIFLTLLVKFERGAMSLPSVRTVRTVKFLTVKLTSRPIGFLSENFCSALPGCTF